MQGSVMERNIILAGKYELLKQIGEGGCSVVYLAWDRHTERHVAIKAEKSMCGDNVAEVLGNESEVLKNEMEMLKMLRHPMLPAVYDFFHEDRWYLVREYIEGKSLHNIIESEGGLSKKRICEWGMQLLDLLSYLHGHSPPIIYRDLKPENIIVCPDGSLRVVDFGAAFPMQYDCGGKRQNKYKDKQAGTVGYAAPEQLNAGRFGAGADERSDIYTFGATLYHMLTGCILPKQPYGITSIRHKAVSMTHKITSLSQGIDRQGIDRQERQGIERQVVERRGICRQGSDRQGIERIVKKCTASDAAKRYQYVEDVKRDLEQVKYPGRREKPSVLFRIEKQIRLADRKPMGLPGMGILLCGMLAGGFAIQARGHEAPLPVTVYNKQGQKLIIRYDSVYSADGGFVFELEQKLFTGEGIKELGISLTDSETGERQERIFYIQGDGK